MNYIGLNYFDTANGPGIRVSLFVSGCTIKCKGCFNKESWNFKAGKPFNDTIKDNIIKELNKPYIEGFSLLGGDPFEPEHEKVLLDLLKDIKSNTSKPIWVWTGRVYSSIKNSPLLEYIDVLIDGPFIKSKAIPDLLYRGSTNQRILNIKDLK